MSGVSTREYRFYDRQQELLKLADELVLQCKIAKGSAGLLPNIRDKRFKPIPPAPGMPSKTRREHEQLCLERMNEANLAAQSLAGDVREFRTYAHWPAGSEVLHTSWQQVSVALESANPRGILQHAMRFDDLDSMAAAIERLRDAIAALKAAGDEATAPEQQRTAQYAAEPQTGKLTPTHSDDFRSVNWFGQPHEFAPNQAACVKVLWDHWKRGGLAVGGPALLEAADCAANRIDVVFRQHPAWGTMIVRGRKRGTYRLAEPTEGAAVSPEKKKSKRARK